MENNPSYQVPYELIAKYLANEVTAAERQQAVAWITEHEAAFEAILQSWEEVDQLRTTQPVDVDAAWERLQARLQAGEESSRRLGPLWQQSLRLAAVVLALVALGWSLMQWLGPGQGPTLLTEATNEAPSRLELQDGSEVVLNQHSSLRYAKDFGEHARREVELQGEAYFDVAEDPERPFVIRAEALEVKVLGTAFNVQAHPDRDTLVVSVVRGRVAVSPLNQSDETVVLKAGMSAQWVRASQELIVRERQAMDAHFWHTGELDLRGSSLQAAIQALKRLYEQDIELDQSLKNCRVGTTLNLKNRDLSYALELLAVTMRARLVQTPMGYRLQATPNSCQ